MIEMRVTGAEELKNKFAQIKADMYESLAAALVAGGFVVSNAAKTNAPKLTGNLARSIHIATKTADITSPERKSGGGTGKGIRSEREVKKVADRLKGKGKAEIFVGTNVAYAAAQEFLGYHHKIGVSPYLRPALDNNRQEVHNEVQRAIAAILKKAAL